MTNLAALPPVPSANDVAARLLALPDRIAGAARHVLEARDLLTSLTENLDLRRLAIAEAVAAEATPEGKPVYSNETRRQTETARRLQLDADCTQLSEQVTTTKRTLHLRELALRHAEDEFRALRSVAQLLTRPA